MTNENTNKPYPVKVREGKNYFICSCKLTKRQPFCDGAHIDTDNHICIKLRKLERYIFVDAKSLKTFPFVMDHTIILNELTKIKYLI